MASAFKFEELITCVICQEVYKDPIALSCLHTLCATCINNLKKVPKKYHCIECPLCRDMTSIDLLKKDFRTQNLVDILVNQTPKKSVPPCSLCQLCRKRDITCKCQDCDKLLCADCRDSHLAIPLCGEHSIISLDYILQQNKVLIEEILAKIKSDKEVCDNQLQQLFEYTDGLDEVKKQTYNDIDTSEKLYLEQVRSYHNNLRSQVNNKIWKQREKINIQKGNIIESICKLETTAQLISDIATINENSATVAAKLGILAQVDLSDAMPSMNSSLGFLNVQLRCKSTYDMSQAVEMVMNVTNTKIQHKCLIVQESPCVASEKRNLSLKSCTLQPPCASTDENQNGKPSSSHENSLHESVKDQNSCELKYCDQVATLIDDIQSKLSIQSSESQLIRKSIENLADLASQSDQLIVEPMTYPIHSLSELVRKRLTKREDIVLERFDCPQKLRLIGNEIWCVYKDKINIYDIFNNNLLRTFKHKNIQNARSVTRASNGDHFVACEHNGLLVFGPTRLYQDSFHGSFSDVTAGGEKIYALEHKQGRILIFCSLQTSARFSTIPHWDWRLFASIQRLDTPSLDDSMLVWGENIFVCSYRSDCVFTYNQKGECKGHTGTSGRGLGELWRPRLCCVDREGSVLVADFYNNRLQLLDRETQWHLVDIQGLNFPWDGVVDAQCGLLVLQQCNINHKVIQFVAIND